MHCKVEQMLESRMKQKLMKIRRLSHKYSLRLALLSGSVDNWLGQVEKKSTHEQKERKKTDLLSLTI